MQSQRVETPDGISWYIERFAPGSGNAAKETIVLVPSGEGDCYNLSKLASLLAAGGPYEILTFDMPAFSRTNLPPKMNPNLTLDQIVEKIVGLLDQLKIQRASFFGCSSGGLVVLTLCANYPSRAKCGIIHEIPLGAPPDALLEMRRNWLEGKMSDEDIVAHCKHVFEQVFIEQDVNDGPRKWEALGSEYHARLAKNYVTWTKLYVGSLEPPTERLASDPGYLRRRPLFWSKCSRINPYIRTLPKIIDAD